MNKTPTVNKKYAVFVKESTTKDNRGTSQNQTNWYYDGCEEDRMADMRQCSKCGKWYHEECVGFSVEYTDDFKCPDGS